MEGKKSQHRRHRLLVGSARDVKAPFFDIGCGLGPYKKMSHSLIYNAIRITREQNNRWQLRVISKTYQRVFWLIFL